MSKRRTTSEPLYSVIDRYVHATLPGAAEDFAESIDIMQATIDSLRGLLEASQRECKALKKELSQYKPKDSDKDKGLIPLPVLFNGN